MSKTRHLGFLSVSKTAALGLAVFPIMPGFEAAGPLADLKADLAKGDDRKGYALSVDSKGTLKLKQIRGKKAGRPPKQ